MSLNISNIKSGLRYGGARPTLFEVQIHNPVIAQADLKAPFLIQAASLPAWHIGTIQVPYKGRILPYAGDRQFQPWSVDIMNDEDFLLRNAFETWQNKINTLEGNVRDFSTTESAQFTSTATVTQFSKSGKALRAYEFLGVYPSEISQIDLAWSSQDQIESFQVTLMYDSYRVSGATGTAGGV